MCGVDTSPRGTSVPVRQRLPPPVLGQRTLRLGLPPFAAAQQAERVQRLRNPLVESRGLFVLLNRRIIAILLLQNASQMVMAKRELRIISQCFPHVLLRFLEV